MKGVEDTTYEWLKWLTVEESVYLHYLMIARWIKIRKTYPSAIMTEDMPMSREMPWARNMPRSREIDKIRIRACKRRERNDSRFAIYLEAMSCPS